MQRVSLRKAVEILQEQGIEVRWGELSLQDFFSYYDKHYAPGLEDEKIGTGRFLKDDILEIFKKDED